MELALIIVGIVAWLFLAHAWRKRKRQRIVIKYAKRAQKCLGGLQKAIARVEPGHVILCSSRGQQIEIKVTHLDPIRITVTATSTTLLNDVRIKVAPHWEGSPDVKYAHG